MTSPDPRDHGEMSAWAPDDLADARNLGIGLIVACAPGVLAVAAVLWAVFGGAW